jgi:hypothetical protein
LGNLTTYLVLTDLKIGKINLYIFNAFQKLSRSLSPARASKKRTRVAPPGYVLVDWTNTTDAAADGDDSGGDGGREDMAAEADEDD